MIIYSNKYRLSSWTLLHTDSFRCIVASTRGLSPGDRSRFLLEIFRGRTVVLTVVPDGRIGPAVAKAYYKGLSKAQREATHDRIVTCIDADGRGPLAFAAAGALSVAKREG